MSDLPLFAGFEPPNPDLSAGRRLTLRQSEAIKVGRHPLGLPLHADADRSARRDDGKNSRSSCYGSWWFGRTSGSRRHLPRIGRRDGCKYRSEVGGAEHGGQPVRATSR